MTIRTTQTVVFFSSSFMVPGLDLPQPAGDYRIDYEEEIGDCVSLLVCCRVDAYIHLPAIGNGRMTRHMVSVAPANLDAMLKNDRRL